MGFDTGVNFIPKIVEIYCVAKFSILSKALLTSTLSSKIIETQMFTKVSRGNNLLQRSILGLRSR